MFNYMLWTRIVLLEIGRHENMIGSSCLAYAVRIGGPTEKLFSHFRIVLGSLENRIEVSVGEWKQRKLLDLYQTGINA